MHGRRAAYASRVEENLIFAGADITNFLDFDAEIEISLGEDPIIMETFTITEPTLIRVPPKMWHGPVVFKRVGAPINFIAVLSLRHYGRVVRENGCRRQTGLCL
jgi:hypothetical protein